MGNRKSLPKLLTALLILALLWTGILPVTTVSAEANAPILNPDLAFWQGVQDSSIESGINITGTVAAPMTLIQAEEFQKAWNVENCSKAPEVDAKGRRIMDIMYTVRAGTVSAVTEGTPYQGRYPGQPERDLLNFLAPNFWQMNQLLTEADIPLVMRLKLFIVEGSNNDPANVGYTAEPFGEFNDRNHNGLCHLWTPGLNFREGDGLYKATRSSGYFVSTYNVTTSAQTTVEASFPIDGALLHESGHYLLDLVDEYFPDVNLEWLRNQIYPVANRNLVQSSPEPETSYAERLAHQEQLWLNRDEVTASTTSATNVVSDTMEAVAGLGKDASWFLNDSDQQACNPAFVRCITTGGLMDSGRILTINGQKRLIGFSRFAQINILWRTRYPELWHPGPYIPTELLSEQLKVRFVGSSIPAGAKLSVYRSNKNGLQDILQKIAIADVTGNEVTLVNPWADLSYLRQLPVFTQAALFLAVRDSANNLIGYSWLDINDVMAMTFTNQDGSVALDKLDKAPKSVQVDLLLAAPNQPLDQSRFGYREEETGNAATFPQSFYNLRESQTAYSLGILDATLKVSTEEAAARLTQTKVLGSIEQPLNQGDLDDLRVQHDRVYPSVLQETLRSYAVYLPADQLEQFVTAKGLGAATSQEKLIAFVQYVLSHEKVVNKALESAGLQTRINLSKIILTVTNVGGEGLNESYEFENASFADNTSQLTFQAQDFWSTADFDQDFLHALSNNVLRTTNEPRPPHGTDPFTAQIGALMGKSIASIGYINPDTMRAERYYNVPWLNAFHTRLVATHEMQLGTNSTVETREAHGFSLAQLPDQMQFVLVNAPASTTYQLILNRYVENKGGEDYFEFVPLVSGNTVTKEQLEAQLTAENGFYSYGHGIIIQATFTDGLGHQRAMYRHLNFKEIMAGMLPAQTGGTLSVSGYGFLADERTEQPNNPREFKTDLGFVHTGGAPVPAVENKPGLAVPPMSHVLSANIQRPALFGYFLPGNDIRYSLSVTTTAPELEQIDALSLHFENSRIDLASGFWRILSQGAGNVTVEPAARLKSFVNLNVGSWTIDPTAFHAAMNPGDIKTVNLTLPSVITTTWLSDEAVRLSANQQFATEYGQPVKITSSYLVNQELKLGKPIDITDADIYPSLTQIYNNGSESLSVQTINRNFIITGSGFAPGRTMFLIVETVSLRLVADAAGNINYTHPLTRKIFLPLIRR